MTLDCKSTTSHQRTKTLGDLLPQSTSNKNSYSRRGSTHPSTLKLMGMDWVFLEETSKTLNMKYSIMKSRPSLQLPSSSTNANSKQFANTQARYLNAKQISCNNTSTDIRSSRSTFNVTNRSRINFSEGISTGCITTPAPNILESYNSTRKSSVNPNLFQSTTTAGIAYNNNIGDQSKELRKRYRTDPCRINITQVDEYDDINEQEELNQMWSSVIGNPITSDNPIVEEKINNILKEVEEEDEMKQQEQALLNKYQQQMEKRALSESQNNNFSLENQEFNKLHRIQQKDKSFKQAYQNKQNQEAANCEMNENQRFNSKVEESHIPLQAIYNKNINLEKDLKQIYMKYEKDPVEIKIPSSKIVKNLVDQRCRRKSRVTSTHYQHTVNDESQANQQMKENDAQIKLMYKDYIMDKIIKGQPINKQSTKNMNNNNPQEIQNNLSISFNKKPDLSILSPYDSTPSNQNQIKLIEYKRNILGEKQETRSKSVIDSRALQKDQIKLPNIREKKIIKPYINSTQIESSTPNIQSKNIKSRLYDTYYIKPSQRFQLYSLKLDNINLTKDAQRNFEEEQMLFNQK